MINLDDLSNLDEFDSMGMRRIVFEMPDQLREAVRLQESHAIPNHSASSGASKGPIIIAGMGGSAIGGDLVAASAVEHLNRPLIVWRDYGLPNYAEAGCDLILSSYSGNTAETLSAFREGLRRGCRTSVVTCGGEMAEIAAAHGIPVYRLPSGYPPRGALAFSTVALWTALHASGLLPNGHQHALEAADILDRLRAGYIPECPEESNPAKRIARQLHGGLPLIYGSFSVTAVAALRWRGQLAENSKMLASHHLLPEMNHNEIVGYELPLNLLQSAAVVFLRDSGEGDRVAQRIEATSKLLQGRIKHLIHIRSSGTSRMARLFSLIYLGDCVSYYAAILNRVDPYPVQMIDALKNSLES